MKEIIYFDKRLFIFFKDEVEAYIQATSNSFFPLFKDINKEIEKNSTRLEERAREGVPPDDIETYYQNLFEEQGAYGDSLCELNGYTALLMISGLYHLWEKRVIQFLHRENIFHRGSEHNKNRSYINEIVREKIKEEEKVQSFNPFDDSNNLNESYTKEEIEEIILYNINTRVPLENFNKIKEKFLNFGIDLEEMSFYPKLDELRCVANAIKHGEGYSFEKLKKINSKILIPPIDQGYTYTGKWTISCVELYPNNDIFRYYGEAVKQFWEHSQWIEKGLYLWECDNKSSK